MKRVIAILAACLLAAQPALAAAPPIPAEPSPFVGMAQTARNAPTIITTAQAQASGGSDIIAVASVSGITVGDTLYGTNVPNGAEIIDRINTSEVIRSANGSFSSGQKVIPFSSTSGLFGGMQCTDVTNPSAIGAGNVIDGISNNVSITLTNNLTGASIGSTDSIQCDPVITIGTASSVAVASGATLTQYPGATSYSAPGQIKLLGGFWASGASGIANLSVTQGTGGGHNWGFGGPAVAWGGGTTSYSFNAVGSDTNNTLDLVVAGNNVFQIGVAAGGADMNIGARADSRFVLLAANGGVFEVSNGATNGTGSGARLICCHAWADSSYYSASPTAGSTIAFADGTSSYDFVYLTPAETLATLTIQTPSSPFDGQEFTILSTQNVTALTLSANSSLSLGGGLPSSLTGNVPVKMKCVNTSGGNFKCDSGHGGTWVPTL